MRRAQLEVSVLSAKSIGAAIAMDLRDYCRTSSMQTPTMFLKPIEWLRG